MGEVLKFSKKKGGGYPKKGVAFEIEGVVLISLQTMPQSSLIVLMSNNKGGSFIFRATT